MAGPPVPPLAFDAAALRARIEQRFRVYDVQTDEHVVAFYVDAPKDTLERDFNELKAELKADGLVPLLKYQGGEHAIYVLRHPERRKRGWKLNLVLFLVTIVTTTLAGSFSAFSYYHQSDSLADLTEMQYVARVFEPANIGLGFLSFALPLMAILTVHEFGHYIWARKHGMEASLPFFIPVPPFLGLNIGTFGAFISMREPMPNRKALFDVGASGPIAGFCVAVPVVLIGLFLMAAHPVLVDANDDSSFTIGTPLLYDLLAAPFHLPDNTLTHPTAFAGWVGLFVTAINLLPAGQLDGGHVASAMFGDRARYASYAAVVGLLGLGLAPLVTIPGIGHLPGYDGWLFFAILIGFLGIRHPPTLDGVSGIDRKRMLVGWLTFAMGILCFTLVPISP
ncbi:MAG TPA: site-2 protease family protein [Candidatus Thermoplasmatota archaeon]|nr:site-2 protease family protein [Candidatus Thermoplasmatota archaeon]